MPTFRFSRFRVRMRRAAFNIDIIFANFSNACMDKFISDLKGNVDALADVEITPDSNLTALPEWDSLALLSTMAMIASEYGVTLKNSEIAAAKSVKALYALVESRK